MVRRILLAGVAGVVLLAALMGFLKHCQSQAECDSEARQQLDLWLAVMEPTNSAVVIETTSAADRIPTPDVYQVGSQLSR